MRTRVLAATALCAACTGGAGLAEARPYEHFPFLDQDSIVVDWCGADMPFRNDFRVAGVITGRITGRDRTLRYTQIAHGKAVWTNLATGRAITIKWNQTGQDLRVWDNGDGTLSILFQASGAGKVYGPDNRLAAIDPGTFRSLVILDHGGTLTDPSDDTFISETLVRETGPPKALEGECDLFRRLTA